MWDVAVKMGENPEDTQTEPSAPRSAALRALAVVLALEAVGLAGAAAFFVVELVAEPSSSVASAIALAVLVAAAAVWVVFIVRGVLRGEAWTRAAVVVVQILIIAVGVGSVQGPEPQPALAAGLIVPAVLALVLLFTRSVVAATVDRSR